MKRAFTLIFALVAWSGLWAQHEPIQPYEELGIKVKVLTLSNGKFQESFPNDTLQRIGSVIFNRVTGEVVSVVERDTIYGEYDLRPEVASRWISPDPMAAKYTAWSPYNYVLNNPLMNIDPRGDTVKVYTETVSATGHVGRHAYLRVTTDKVDVIIELWGPNESETSRKTGRPQYTDYEHPNQITSRSRVQEGVVERPRGIPEGDYSFENSILENARFFTEHTTNAEGKKDFYNLPEYAAFGPNSNGYVSALVEMADGKLILPWNAFAQTDTNAYKMSVLTNALRKMSDALNKISDELEKKSHRNTPKQKQ